ncbi:hypothetical protein PQR71_17995 [Paraburkholderia fungorum]|uniref:NrtR DNA-binding winged helix domain-containing protein n=1 Tax=Paraburkholderia fungorum TaxID=134537 RepID=UPI0038BAEEA4
MSMPKNFSSSLVCSLQVAVTAIHNGELYVILEKVKGHSSGTALLTSGIAVNTANRRENQDLSKLATDLVVKKMHVAPTYVEQVHAFLTPFRPGRESWVNVTYSAIVKEDTLLHLPETFSLVPAAKLPKLVDDLNFVAEIALQKMREKANHSTLPFFFLSQEFTLPELQQAYEILLGRDYTRSNFQRKLLESAPPYFIELLPNQQRTSFGRPAQLYRMSPGARIAIFQKSI